MKRVIPFVLVLLASPALAGPNPAFETLKSLAGTWSGKAISGEGPGSDPAAPCAATRVRSCRSPHP